MTNTKAVAISPINRVWKDFRSRLFEGLSPSDRESILRTGMLRRLPAHSVVVKQGFPANEVFLLITGRARNIFVTEDGEKIILNWLVPGDIFGAYAALAICVANSFGTETVKTSEVLVWSRALARSLIARFPRLSDNGLLIAREHLDWYLAANVALSCYPARRRLAQVLVTLAKGIGQEVSGGTELDVTNEELAHAANVTLFTASRLMSQWEREGSVIKHRCKVLLRSPEKLFVHAA